MRVSNTKKAGYVSNLQPRDYSSPVTAALENEKNLGTGLPIFLFTRRW